jgi:uncharacterized protein YjbJ (UPF0337 family)
MGLGDFADKAKDLLKGHEDQADGAIDKGEGLAKDRLPDQADGAIDAGGDKARDYLHSEDAPPA